MALQLEKRRGRDFGEVRIDRDAGALLISIYRQRRRNAGDSWLLSNGLWLFLSSYKRRNGQQFMELNVGS
jgi:hypothetical protein